MASGYSSTPLPRKLGIKAHSRLALLGAPAGLELGELPGGVRIVRRAGGMADVIVSFHDDRAGFTRRLPALRAMMRPASASGSPGPSARRASPTDMTEDVVRAVALPTGLVDNKVCAIDDVWSGLRLVIRLRDR